MCYVIIQNGSAKPSRTFAYAEHAGTAISESASYAGSSHFGVSTGKRLVAKVQYIARVNLNIRFDNLSMLFSVTDL
jgi:hypothetical protein